MLAKVYESPEVTGYVTAEVAKLTGLKEGTPVVGGAGDNAAAAVGTGVVVDVYKRQQKDGAQRHVQTVSRRAARVAVRNE